MLASYYFMFTEKVSLLYPRNTPNLFLFLLLIKLYRISHLNQNFCAMFHGPNLQEVFN